MKCSCNQDKANNSLFPYIQELNDMINIFYKNVHMSFIYICI